MTATPSPELYVDGLLDVSFARGTVRLDLYSLSATETEPNGQPKPAHRQRLVMSAQSFVDFIGTLQAAGQSLRDKGVFGPQPAQQPQAGQPVAQQAVQAAAAEAVQAEVAPTAAPGADAGAPADQAAGTEKLPTQTPTQPGKRAPQSPNFAPRGSASQAETP